MSFKILHEFTLPIQQEVEETSTRTEGGKTITETAKVTKEVLVRFVLKDPSRREKQEVALWQSVKQGEAIMKLGLPPRLLMLQKLQKDTNNPLAGQEDKALVTMNARLHELANDYIRAVNTKEPDDRIASLQLEFMTLQKRIVDIETAYQSMFAHTAEQYANSKCIEWLALNLTYIKMGAKYEPLFKGDDLAAKEKRLEELDDTQDKVYLVGYQKLATCWMLYFLGRASTPEDFKRIEDEWLKEQEAAKKAAEVDETAVKVVDPAQPIVAAEPAPATPSPSAT